MKAGYIVLLVLIAAATLLAVHLHSQQSEKGPVAHVENGFEFTVHAPYAQVAPLFGADGERAWGGKHWDPHFLYPQPARDIEGEVFTVSHGHADSVWVNTAFDLQAGHVQYVYVVPDAQVALVDIHLRHDDPATTQVKVTYQRTALNPSFNDHLAEMGHHDSTAASEWQSAIETYLKANTAR